MVVRDAEKECVADVDCKETEWIDRTIGGEWLIQLALEDGHVVNGPTAFPARCYDVRVRGGYIEVRAVKTA